MWYDRRLFQIKFHYLWKKWINVIFINQHHINNITNWYELLTVPFPMPIDTIFLPKRIGIWNRYKFRFYNDFFSDKTSNLNNQFLNVVIIEHEPAIKIIQSKNNQTIYIGVEIEIIKTLAQKLNFSLNITTIKNLDHLAFIKAGYADIILGDLYYNLENIEIMDLSTPYNTECLTFLTPEYLLDFSYKTLILPFKFELWITILIVLFLIAIILHIINNFKIKYNDTFLTRNNSSDLFHNFNSILYTFGILLMVSLPRLSNMNSSLRILISFHWVYSIIMVQIYKASMTAILSNPVVHSTIDNAEELIGSNIGYGGLIKHIKNLFLQQNDSVYRKIGDKYEILNDSSYGINKVINGKFAFFESVYYLRNILEDHEVNENEPNKQLHIMQTCIINMPISIGLQKSSPLKHKFNQYLQEIIESGLISKWIKDFGYRIKKKKINKATITSNTNNITKQAVMNLRKFFMAFVWIISGLSISIIVFLIEYFYWHRIVKQRNNFDKYRLDEFYKNKNQQTFLDLIF